jgi:hypothetical protein
LKFKIINKKIKMLSKVRKAMVLGVVAGFAKEEEKHSFNSPAMGW